MSNDPGLNSGTETATAVAPTTKVRKPKAKAVKKGKVKAAKKGKAKAHKAAKGNIFDPIYREQYKVHKDHKAPGGGARITCNDQVAVFLLDKTDADLEKLANRVGQSERWNGWSGLNVGMRRMNFGNVLRGMIRRGEYVLSKDGNLTKGEGKPKAKKAKAEAK